MRRGLAAAARVGARVPRVPAVVGVALTLVDAAVIMCVAIAGPCTDEPARPTLARARDESSFPARTTREGKYLRGRNLTADARVCRPLNPHVSIWCANHRTLSARLARA